MRPDAGPTGRHEGAPAPAARPAWVLGGAGLLLLCLVWEAVARLGLGARPFSPGSHGRPRGGRRMARSGELGRHVGVSLARMGLGFGLGAAAGTVLGLGLGTSRALWAVGNPIIAATYPIPKIALLPLMILWLGIGETPKVVMIALGVFFPVVINTHAGVRGTDPLW